MAEPDPDTQGNQISETFFVKRTTQVPVLDHEVLHLIRWIPFLVVINGTINSRTILNDLNFSMKNYADEKIYFTFEFVGRVLYQYLTILEHRMGNQSRIYVVHPVLR